MVWALVLIWLLGMVMAAAFLWGAVHHTEEDS